MISYEKLVCIFLPTPFILVYDTKLKTYLLGHSCDLTLFAKWSCQVSCVLMF